MVVVLVLAMGGKGVLQNLRAMNPSYFLLAVCLQMCHMGLWSLRWSVIIRAQGQRVPRDIVAITFAGAFFNNMTPVSKSGGEPVRSYFVGKAGRMSFEEGLASVIVDRVFDMAPFVLICLGTFFLMTLAHMTSNLILLTFVILGLATSAILSAVIVSASLRKETGMRLLLFVIDRLAPLIGRFRPVDQVRTRAKQALETFHLGVSTISRNRSLLLASLLISLLSWGTVILRLKTVFLSLGWDVPLLVINVVAVASIFAEFLPLLPGGLGATEATMIALFIGLGVRRDISGSAIFVDRIISYWIVTLVGALATAYLTYKFGVLKGEDKPG